MTSMSTVVVLLFAWAVLVLSSPCQTLPTPRPCTCVPSHLCVHGNVVTDGDNVLNERFLSVASTSPSQVTTTPNQCNDSEVCCKAPAEEDVDTVVVEPSTSQGPPAEDVSDIGVTEPPTSKAPSEAPQTSPSCTCVPSHLCVHGNVVTDGDNILNERFLSVPTTPQPEANHCNASEVCCKAPAGEDVDTLVSEQPTSQASPGESVPTLDVAEPATSHVPPVEGVDELATSHGPPVEGVDELATSHGPPVEGVSELATSHGPPGEGVTEPPTSHGPHGEVAPTRDVIQPPTSPLHTHVQKCGVRNVTEGLNLRIVDTSDKKPNELDFPWQAALFLKDGNVNKFLCGGTLIGSRFVMTAAHYVISLNAAQLKVRLGDLDLQNDVEEFPHQDVDASEIIIHPEFRRGPNYNDIALVHLAEPAKFAPNINTACLPKPGFEYPSGKTCTVSGWGKTSFDVNALYSNITQAADVPLVDNKKCQQLLRKTRLGRFFILHTSFLCAGGEKGKDSCTGDGGGPLVCEENETFSVAGIVAWGIGCGEENVPGVYVKVSQFTTWIEGIIATKTIS